MVNVQDIGFLWVYQTPKFFCFTHYERKSQWLNVPEVLVNWEIKLNQDYTGKSLDSGSGTIV